jgi:hypothetical protein
MDWKYELVSARASTDRKGFITGLRHHFYGCPRPRSYTDCTLYPGRIETIQSIDTAAADQRPRTDQERAKQQAEVSKWQQEAQEAMERQKQPDMAARLRQLHGDDVDGNTGVYAAL